MVWIFITVNPLYFRSLGQSPEGMMFHVVHHREHFRQHSSLQVKEPQVAFYTAPSIVMPNPSLKDFWGNIKLTYW